MIYMEVNKEPLLYDPETDEVFLEFQPASNYPVVVQAYFDDVVVPRQGHIFLPSKWLIENFPAAGEQVKATAEFVRKKFKEEDS